MKSEKDAFQKAVSDYRLKDAKKWAGTLALWIGIVSGLFIIATVLEIGFGYTKEEAFRSGSLWYLLLLVVLFLARYGKVSLEITRDPFRALRSNPNPDLVHQLISRLYGVEQLEFKETININKDGSYTSRVERTLLPKAEKIRSIEITGNYVGPVEGAGINLDESSFEISPDEFKNITLKPISQKEGLFEVRFPRDLEIDKQVKLDYPEAGVGEVFAVKRENYPSGLSYDYAMRNMQYPTKHLSMNVKFEDGYPVAESDDRPEPMVWYGNAKVEHVEEKKRLTTCFTYRDRYARLNLPTPIVGLNYAIRWRVVN